MKIIKLTLIVMSICVFLAACGKKNDSENNTDGIKQDEQQDADQGDENLSADGNDNQEDIQDGQEDETDITDSEEPEEEEEDENLTPEEKAYRKMIKASLTSTGNNYRLKKVIDKAQKGEEVAIAYIGGSITEGANATTKENNYASLSYNAFKERFAPGDGSNVTMVNAGMGGTPSSLGVIRYKRDVLDKLNKTPDIVVIEFAVNDHEEVTKGEAYESLVREILSVNDETAVILLFSVFQSRWNQEDLYRPLGTLYGLPMVSVKKAVVPALDIDKTLTDSEYFGDAYHPTNYGHAIMADCIAYLYDTVAKEEMAEQDVVLSDKTFYGDSYMGIKMMTASDIADNVTLQTGSFASKDNTSWTFRDNWMHLQNSGNDEFTIKLTCKNMLLVHKHSNKNTTGKVEIYVDGELKQTVNGYNPGGWNNPVVISVLKEETAAEHTITIKMAEGDEAKEFTILAIGYTE